MQGESPQSDTSDNTAFTSESYTSTFSAGSDQPQPRSSPTLEEQQEGLPEEIKRKTYPSSNLVNAEDELFEDLKEHSLEDSDKVVVINEDGKAIWAMPTVFHQYVLQKLLQRKILYLLRQTLPFLWTRRQKGAGILMYPSGDQAVLKLRKMMTLARSSSRSRECQGSVL